MPTTPATPILTVGDDTDLFPLCRAIGGTEGCGYCPHTGRCAGTAPPRQSTPQPLYHPSHRPPRAAA